MIKKKNLKSVIFRMVLDLQSYAKTKQGRQCNWLGR